ncbi:MAG: hypothetical protein ACK5LT_10830 [Lachnospirales bacterium]
MRILLVSINPLVYNTSATIQNRGFLVGLCENGHEVDTLTMELNKKNLAYDESLESINKYIRKKYYLKLSNSYNTFSKKKDGVNSKWSLKPLAKKIYYKFKIYDAQSINIKNINKLEINLKNYDVILSCSDPKSSHLLVMRLLEYHNIKNYNWIQYWGDPMLKDITREKGILDFLVKKEEHKLLNKGTKIIYATKFTEKIQKEIFKEFNEKITSVNLAHNFMENNKTISTVNTHNLTFGYYGAYYSKVRNILNLYNVCIKENLNLNICGDSDIQLSAVGNVKIFNKMNYKNVLEMEGNTDVLICILNRYGTQIPGKIFYLASYNKPIIIIIDGKYKEEMEKNFREYDRYILCENNEKDILNALNKAEEEILLGKNYIAPTQMSPDVVAKKILS